MFCVNKQMYMMYAQDMTLDVIFKKHQFELFNTQKNTLKFANEEPLSCTSLVYSAYILSLVSSPCFSAVVFMETTSEPA